MQKEELLGKKLGRMKSRIDRLTRGFETRLSGLDTLYREYVREHDEAKAVWEKSVVEREEQLKAELDQAGKEFAKNKYMVERDASVAKVEMDKAQEAFEKAQKNVEREIARLNEEKTNHRITLERQKAALQELYQEQRRHLLTNREKLVQQWTQLENNYNTTKAKFAAEASKVRAEREQQLAQLKEQVEAKKEGWKTAVATIQREYELLAQEKAATEKRLTTVRDDKEKELEDVRISMKVAKEQLEIDKATLVEKAEEDQRRCEADVHELQEKINRTELELQNLIVHNEASKKDAEQGFEKEESILKEAVRVETEKRDYEQKLFQEEKGRKEKEIARLREEYEKKKWHWENQVRALMMKKSVQEAEFESERMRIDREARVSFRSLEAKRDELKQRQADLKSRYDSLAKNAEKEKELMTQRWQWRRDRLWSMWQGRLDVIRKERQALQEQMQHLMDTYSKEKGEAADREVLEEKKIGDLQQYVLQITDRSDGQRKQKEIQNELEKTHLIAQIKECEALISEWMDRLKMAQDEMASFNTQFSGQMNFAERLFRDEEKETELFLHDLQRALAMFGVSSDEAKKKQDAA